MLDRTLFESQYSEIIQMLDQDSLNLNVLFSALTKLGKQLQDVYPNKTSQDISIKIAAFAPPLIANPVLSDTAIKNLELLFDSSVELIGLDDEKSRNEWQYFRIALSGVVGVYGMKAYSDKSKPINVSIEDSEFLAMKKNLVKCQQEVRQDTDNVQVLVEACENLLITIEDEIKKELLEADNGLHYVLFVQKNSMVTFYEEQGQQKRKDEDIILGVPGLISLERDQPSEGTMASYQAQKLQEILQKNERLKTSVEQYKAVQELSSKLKTPEPASVRLSNFKADFKIKKPLIEKRNDSATTIFLNVVKTVVFAVSLVKIGDISSIWKTPGDKFSDTVEPQIQPRSKL